MYADYEFYKDTFGGTMISESEFTRLMIIASAYVDKITFNRAMEISEDDPTYRLLKLAACDIAEVLKREDEGGEIQSESVGSYSVSYADTPTKKLSLEEKIIQAGKRYLGNTGLMYRGF